MAAGAVSVPTIMPLRAPHFGQHKTAVDSRTKIELQSGNYSRYNGLLSYFAKYTTRMLIGLHGCTCTTTYLYLAK